MDDFWLYTVSPDYDYSYSYEDNSEFILHVVTCVIVSISLPLTLWAIYAVYCEVRNDHVAPIYIINLLISDIIQQGSLIVWEADRGNLRINVVLVIIYNFGVAASICFMVSVAMERYLVIACPLWYRFKRTIKFTVVVCLIVWTVPLVFLLTFYFFVDFKVGDILYGIFFLLPFPLLIFFLGGTLKALSASYVPSDEKRRIVGILVLVLLIYTLMFLPRTAWFLADTGDYNSAFNSLTLLIIKFSPLADLFLYVFMRKGVIDNLLSSVCCRMDSNDSSVPAV